MSIGENIITTVSAPLANTIFSTESESDTFDSLRAKTAELLVALDVIASAAHDLESIAETAQNFKEAFENTERRMTENERENLHSLASIPSGVEITEDEKSEIIQTIDTVTNGTVTQVTDLNGTTYGSLVPKTYVLDTLQEEETLQTKLLNDALNTQQTHIRQPLNSITTIKRLKGGYGGADPDLSVSVFSSPKFKGTINTHDFQTAEKFITTNGLSTHTSSKGYISTAISRNTEASTPPEHTKTQASTTPTTQPRTQQPPQVMVMPAASSAPMAATMPRQTASFSRTGAYGSRSRTRFEQPGSPSTGIITTTAGPTAPPTQGTFTSGFGPRWGTMHNGIDIAAPIGTPIYAAKDGVVIDSGPAQGFGNWIRIQHEDGTITTYGHMSTLSARVGDEVRAGDYIAGMGSEGQSTGSHLHFEVTDPNGNKVDPLPWLHAHGITDWG